jgi:hypothetical protein
MDKVTTEKGYAGPVVVCSISYEPIAGHRASNPLVKYLSEGREMEMALAPITGTRLLAPFRLSVVSMLANVVMRPIDSKRLRTHWTHHRLLVRMRGEGCTEAIFAAYTSGGPRLVCRFRRFATVSFDHLVGAG